MPYIVIDNTEWEKKYCWGGREIIELDIENPKKFKETHQFWSNSELVTYYVDVEIRKQNAKTTVSVTYSKGKNPHLPSGDIIWGTHILLLEEGANAGKTIWKPESSKEMCGPGWKKEKRQRVKTTKTKRWQAAFRTLLLKKDGKCALSREKCEDSLDASHIVPVWRGGPEIPTNGLLLRADLHRLYDATHPKFKICPESGQVVAAAGFNYGSFDLSNCRIDETTLRRVRKALYLRQQEEG